MAVAFPVAGSFSAYSTRFLDPAWGFAMGWNYAIQWLVVLPLEIVAASITLGYWPGAANTNSAAWVTIFFVVIVAINFIGVKGYGEAEFIFSIIKVVAVIGFIILGIVLDCGGGPDGENIGDRYWYPNRVAPNYSGYDNPANQDASGNPLPIVSVLSTTASRVFAACSSPQLSPSPVLSLLVLLPLKLPTHVKLFQLLSSKSSGVSVSSTWSH